MLSILGVGHAHPKTVIDNAFLESLDIGTTNEWIMERVGIATRYSVLPLDYIAKTRNQNPAAACEAAETNAVQLGAEAARQAMQSAGISPAEIGMVVCGESIPHMLIPAHACMIAGDLGIKAPAFDLNSACSTFSAQLHFLNCLKEDKIPDYVLLIQTETYTMSLNYNDRTSAVLFGDGAAAQILSAKHPGKATISHSVFDSDPLSWKKIYTPPHGHFTQEGSAVQRFAIQQTVKTFKQINVENHAGKHLYFIGHQANLRMLETSRPISSRGRNPGGVDQEEGA